MKSKEVLRILRVSRPTLTRYVKEGTIKATLLQNGQYDYDEASVYAFIFKNVERKTALYCRASTVEEKQNLIYQEDELKQFCFNNGHKIDYIYKDIMNEEDFNMKSDLLIILDEIISGNIGKVIILSKDVLIGISFEIFSYLLNKYNCEIIVVKEGNDLDIERHALIIEQEVRDG